MKEPYQVMLIKDDKIIYESDWVMADNQKAAEMLVVAEQAAAGGLGYTEEVRVLSRPFCG